MVFPTPTYRESIHPLSIRGVKDICDEKTVIRAYEAVGRHIFNTIYIFHKSSQDRGSDRSYDQFSGITPDSIIISSSAETKMGSRGFHTERVPLSWEIEVFSFATPVDKVKKDLVEIMEKAAKK